MLRLGYYPKGPLTPDEKAMNGRQVEIIDQVRVGDRFCPGAYTVRGVDGGYLMTALTDELIITETNPVIPAVRCSLCQDEDEVPGEYIGECLICHEGVCDWHGKEFHRRTLNGIAHNYCAEA